MGHYALNDRIDEGNMSGVGRPAHHQVLSDDPKDVIGGERRQTETTNKAY